MEITLGASLKSSVWNCLLALRLLLNLLPTSGTVVFIKLISSRNRLRSWSRYCMQWRIQVGRIGRAPPPPFSADFLFCFLFVLLFTPEFGLVGGRYPYIPHIVNDAKNAKKINSRPSFFTNPGSATGMWSISASDVNPLIDRLSLVSIKKKWNACREWWLYTLIDLLLLQYKWIQALNDSCIRLITNIHYVVYAGWLYCTNCSSLSHAHPNWLNITI